MKESDLNSTNIYHELLGIAAKHGIKAEVNIIIDNQYDQENKDFDAAMQKLGLLENELQTLEELAHWLSLKSESLTDERYRQKGKAKKEKKYISIIGKIRTRAEKIISGKCKKKKKNRILERMDELIKSGKTQRSAAYIVHEEEVAAGRKPIASETIRTRYNNRNK